VEQGYGVCGARDERAHAGQQQQLVDHGHDVIPGSGSGKTTTGSRNFGSATACGVSATASMTGICLRPHRVEGRAGFAGRLATATLKLFQERGEMFRDGVVDRIILCPEALPDFPQPGASAQDVATFG
jgi:hypothetical protein